MSMTFGGQPAGSPAPAAAGDLIKDSSTQTFMQDVIEPSRQQPVIVDFWAPWCGPCHMMAPAFEEAARQMEPAVRFAKLNTDEAQDVAAGHAEVLVAKVFAGLSGEAEHGLGGLGLG